MKDGRQQWQEDHNKSLEGPPHPDSMAAKDAEIARLRAALQPFSDMAGELFARNWNASQIVTVLDNPDDPHRITAGDYFAARQAVMSVTANEEQ